MQTGTITAKPRAFFAAATADKTFRGHTIDHQSDGTAIVRDVKVFKAGTFRDSWGDQHTWTSEHLQQMVDNFILLKSKNVFPDPPVRADHSMSIDKVKGYFESVRTDGQFLYGDLRLTEKDALDKSISGTYRNVSLEVGMFVANDESAYWPVVYGVAYVDIPAVEGLHAKNSQVSYFSQTLEKEALVGAENGTTVPNTGGVTINLNSGGNLVPDPKPTPTADHSKTTDGTGTQPPAPTAPYQFRVNGGVVTDFGAVQAHITALEGFRQTMIEEGRKSFVSKLSSDKKILESQVESLQEFALDLSPEQFEKWCKSYDAQAPLPVLQQHGQHQTDQGAPNEPADDEKSNLEEQIKMFKRAGKDDAWIANTKAAKALAAMNAKS